MNAMCERADMFERLIYERPEQSSCIFGLPFDAPAPD